jgi:hypothetical protein
MTEPIPVTVHGIDEDTPPELLAALERIGRAAVEAFGEPGDTATVIVEDGPCEDLP